MNASPIDLRSDIESQVTVVGTTEVVGHLTPQFKRALDFAFDEARQLDSDDLRPEHLLLGSIREDEGLAGQMLKQHKIDLQRTRNAIKTM